jgi:hypothetical protein
LTITNYEMLEHFPSDYSGVVLDESSILKSYSGKFRSRSSPRLKTRLPTGLHRDPAPNDYMELGNHAEFLGR